MKTFFLLLGLALVSYSQTLTLDSLNRTTFHQGDTLAVHYHADSAYQDSGISNGTVVDISVGGKYKLFYITQHPIESSDIGSNKVYLDDPFFGNVHIIIPDTLLYTQREPFDTVSTVSDSALIKVRDYSAPSIKTASTMIRILPATVPVRQPAGRSSIDNFNAQGHRVAMRNGKLVSALPLASVAFYDLNGRCIAKRSLLSKKEYPVGDILQKGPCLAACTFEDAVRESLFLIIGF